MQTDKLYFILALFLSVSLFGCENVTLRSNMINDEMVETMDEDSIAIDDDLTDSDQIEETTERDGSCDDGSFLHIADPTPECINGEIPAIIIESWYCVNPETCVPNKKIDTIQCSYNDQDGVAGCGLVVFDGLSLEKKPYASYGEIAGVFRFKFVPHYYPDPNDHFLLDITTKTLNPLQGHTPFMMKLTNPFIADAYTDNITWLSGTSGKLVNGYFTGEIKIEEYIATAMTTELVISGENLFFVEGEEGACKVGEYKYARCPDHTEYKDEQCLGGEWAPIDYGYPGPCE